MTTTSGSVRIHQLLDYIREGRIMDAMHEFYSEDVIMEEPAYGKTVGLPANLEREQGFVDSVKAFRNFQAANVTVGENISYYENVMDWTDQNDNDIHAEQVVVAEWKDGKIVRERFYYSAA